MPRAEDENMIQAIAPEPWPQSPSMGRPALLVRMEPGGSEHLRGYDAIRRLFLIEIAKQAGQLASLR